MKISICIPYHDTPKTAYFLTRALASISIQTFTDYEIILTKEGKMAENTNAAIKKAQGEIVKILYMDDFLAHENSLKMIVEAFDKKTTWLVTGCVHDTDGNITNPHIPEYTDDIYTGNNGIGSPSVLAFRRKKGLLFDEKLSFLLDCDLYKRYYETFGKPKILDDMNVVIGLHKDQTSNTMSDGEKKEEGIYMLNKYHG